MLMRMLYNYIKKKKKIQIINGFQLIEASIKIKKYLFPEEWGLKLSMKLMNQKYLI